MKCPACTNELKMADRQGVEIDYCPNCRGVWLDRGELDKIIERSLPSALDRDDDDDDGDRRHYRGSPPPGPAGGHYEQRYPRKKSFLRELFDFD